MCVCLLCLLCVCVCVCMCVYNVCVYVCVYVVSVCVCVLSRRDRAKLRDQGLAAGMSAGEMKEAGVSQVALPLPFH